MRIDAICLSWFRGAADPVTLELGSKSMVVYGVNGSGKSSFVDALEYVLNDGKIGHLAHEYSGKRQEKALPNTHRPQGAKTELRIRFKDDSEFKTEIKQGGSSSIESGAEAVAVGSWDYRRTVLRQDEVAKFIHDTKGGKYSALLPLLGLHHMEVAAENLRKLANSVEEQSKLRDTKIGLQSAKLKRNEKFGTDSDEQIVERIQTLHMAYCGDKTGTKDALSRCTEIAFAIEARIAAFSADQKRHVILQDVAALKLTNDVSAVRTYSGQLAGAVEPLIAERLEVLQSTGSFVDKLGDEQEVRCPACGRFITVKSFQDHVVTERERLQEIIKIFERRKTAINKLSDTLKSLKSSLGKSDVASWQDEITTGPLTESFLYLKNIDADALRTSCTEADLEKIESNLLPLIRAAKSATQDAPPDVQELSANKQVAEAAAAALAASVQAAVVAHAEDLVSFVKALEQGVREEIKVRSEAVISNVSADVQAMWAVIHPDKAIEGIHLYLPDDADKAVEIGLKFYGVQQDSPRLTLSEGYRNGLGLCIFLAMAKREERHDRPLFLDDVVVSLDRNHRGMIVELLKKDFDKRQVVILTHDRDWYTEMRHQLDEKHWVFKALLPYQTPNVGIRWSHKTTTFEDARAHLKDRPDSAANDARKIMDVELALIAERLRIRLPYLRGDKNDRRIAHEFLQRLVADGEKCFQKRSGDVYEGYTDALEALDAARRRLESWGNRGSHSFDVEPAEASKLIDICETALDSFKCTACSKNLWFADSAGPEWVQCGCGQMRWRYGKT